MSILPESVVLSVARLTCLHHSICEEDYTIHPVSSEDLDGRDFPWAPRVPMKKLRSSKEYPQLFTGTYTTSARLGEDWSWESSSVRHHGTQHYTNGDMFVGSFGNLHGLPSEGTYTFANGDFLRGHFKIWYPSPLTKKIVSVNSIVMGTFFNKELNKSFSGRWGLSPAHAPAPGVCYLVESSEEGGYIVVEDYEVGGITWAIYYRYGLFFKNFHEWLQWVCIHNCPQCADADYDEEEPSFPSLYELGLHQDSPEALWLASFKTQVNFLIGK